MTPIEAFNKRYAPETFAEAPACCRDAWMAAWTIAWAQAEARCVDIIETHHIPVGNSAAGEMACEWTYDALQAIRDRIQDKEDGK